MIDKIFAERLKGKLVFCAVTDSRHFINGRLVDVGESSVLIERYGMHEVIAFDDISRLQEVGP